MNDFKKLIRSIEDGNLNEVVNSFRTDFLERTTDDDMKWRPIHLACSNSHLEIVTFLLENKCTIEYEDKDKRRPIHLACWNGHWEIVKLLLEYKCSIECADKDKKRPIHLACWNGHWEIVKLLLEYKCTIECADKDKRRPIHLACQNGHLEIVKLLLENKCTIECEDKYKWRPIHLACWNGHWKIVKLFLEYKCSIECADKYKWRPIHLACWNGHLDIVKFLCQCNCNIYYRTKDGQTPIEIARKWGHKSCENLLGEILQSRKSNTNLKLKTAVETLTYKGGDIYQEMPSGIETIDFCLPMDSETEFKAFQKTERNRDSQINEEYNAKEICSSCHATEVNYEYECGHTVCGACCLELLSMSDPQCQICNAECTDPKYIYK